MNSFATTRSGRRFLIFTSLVGALFLAQNPALSQNSIRQIREKARPGKYHALLEAFSGKWKIRIQYRIRPETNPETAVGTAEFHWILGKRFLEQIVNGKGIAGSYEGRGIVGYDNVLGHYSGMWVDTMNTGLSRSIGSVEADGKTFHFKFTGTNPLKGKEASYDAVFRILDRNRLHYRLVQSDPETGNSIAMLTIDYRRK